MSVRIVSGRRLAIAGVTTAAIFSTLGTQPADALATLTPVLKAPSTSPYSVAGGCAPAAGATTNLNQLTYVIEGTASATSTKAGVYAVSTGVTCTIRKKSNNAVVGSISGVLPGPNSLAAGTITVQLTDVVKLCWVGVAHFSDNYIRTEPEKCA